MPAAIARLLLPNVEPWTITRSMRLNVFSKIDLRISTAPTGTCPPDSAFGEQHHVRLDAPMFDRQKASSAADAGLDFIGHEQRAIAAAQALRRP